LNYFNYFTEVEDEFVRRRGAHLLISPMDWALVESWKNAGIPLHVVLRGINRAFDAWDERAPRYRKVNSVFYCVQAVDEALAEYRLSQVGAAEASPGETTEATPKGKRFEKSAATYTRESLIEFLDRSAADLAGQDSAANSLAQRPPIIDAIGRAAARLAEIRSSIQTAESIDLQALERDLDSLDELLLGSLKTAATPDELESMRKEAEAQLRGYKKKMEKAIYLQTVDNFVARRLRETAGVPRLSLFYMM
jgi:hypothetical protein